MRPKPARARRARPRFRRRHRDGIEMASGNMAQDSRRPRNRHRRPCIEHGSQRPQPRPALQPSSPASASTASQARNSMHQAVPKEIPSAGQAAENFILSLEKRAIPSRLHSGCKDAEATSTRLHARIGKKQTKLPMIPAYLILVWKATLGGNLVSSKTSKDSRNPFFGGGPATSTL